jgi:NRPS condensation-like uncharacterized protein
MKQHSQWFRIDHAGKLFPVVSNRLRSSYFRQAVQLNVFINPELLQRAALLTLKRFPHFDTRLKKGIFWNYLEAHHKVFKVKMEPNTFGSITNPFYFGKHLLNIYYYEKRISVEYFHVLTDGRGGMEFLKTLTLTYLQLSNYDVQSDGLLKDAYQPTDIKEQEDSFNALIEPGKATWLPSQKAYHLEGTIFKTVGHHLTHLTFSLSEVLALSRRLNTTITAFYASVLAYMMLQQQKIDNVVARKPIIISVPVDMRKYFPSMTMKNFVMTIGVGKVFALDSTFESIVEEITMQLKTGQSIEKLAPQIRANMKAEKILLLRFVPLFFKNLLIKSVYNKIGEPALSITLSNLGKVVMPEKTFPYIDHFEFMLSSTYLLPINMAIASFNDALVVTFSRLIEENKFVVDCVDFLTKKYQLQIVASGNGWEN